MTRYVSGSAQNSSRTSAQYEADLQDYVQRMQRFVQERLNYMYFVAKRLDELSYRRLSLETYFEGDSIDEACDHFIKILYDMVDACRAHLIERIRKGEEYLEKIGEDHPKYQDAVNLYVQLVNELATYNQ